LPGDRRDALVTPSHQLDRLGLELIRERSPRPPLPLAHDTLLSHFRASWGVHEIGGGSQCPTVRSFRRCIVRVMLRPVCLPSPPGWLRQGAAICPAPCLPRTSSPPLLASPVAGRRWGSG